MRVVFLGSPDFALPTLEALASRYALVGVLTQPDRPAGRGRVLASPPVKQAALRLGVPILQPPRLRAPEATAALAAWNPDLIVVAAFGQILRAEVLDLPTHGCLNVHASLLPRWRGASPVPAAIRAGDPETGVTLMRMDIGMDTGPVLAHKATPISPSDTGGSLLARLAEIGALLLVETLPAYLAGTLEPVPQVEGRATYAPLLRKEDGRLNFSHPAEELERQVRAYDPWPGTFLEWDDRRLAVLRASASDAPGVGIGECTRLGGFPAIGTSRGLLVLDTVQPAGRQPVSGDAFLRGAPAFATTRITPAADGS